MPATKRGIWEGRERREGSKREREREIKRERDARYSLGSLAYYSHHTQEVLGTNS